MQIRAQIVSTFAWGAVLMFALSTSGASNAAQQPQPPRWSWPDTPRNPQVLPRDIGPQQLRATMLEFVNALDVSCSHCHAGSEEMSLAERDFASDANPRKNVARAMIRMVQQLNDRQLPAIEGLSEPRVTCYTCHRGAIEPATAPPPEASQ